RECNPEGGTTLSGETRRTRLSLAVDPESHLRGCIGYSTIIDAEIAGFSVSGSGGGLWRRLEYLNVKHYALRAIGADHNIEGDCVAIAYRLRRRQLRRGHARSRVGRKCHAQWPKHGLVPTPRIAGEHQVISEIQPGCRIFHVPMDRLRTS